jgi:nascent polypeptide-associated complex subunit alpha
MKINPKQLEKMAKRMGIDTQNVDAVEVIIRKSDGGEIVISNPTVSKINMMGQDSWQVSGDAEERAPASESKVTDDDVKMVAEQTGVSEDKARDVLTELDGDIAAAIMKLKKK